MEFFWANIGTTHKEVIEGNFLWAPVSSPNKKGTEVHRVHWDNVGLVKKSDVIFCCHDQRISFLAKATADAYEEQRPASRSFREWNPKGHRVDIAITPLVRSVFRDEISAEFIDRFDERTSPALFTADATLKQIYMAHLPADAGIFLLEATEQLGLFEDALITMGSASNRKIANTTREALIQARVGQGQFRKDLIKRWRGQCALTGLRNRDLLVASHIDAWSLCDNEARLDPDNGFLLATHIDRLFDRGLVSFTDDGNLRISSKLTEADRRVFALDQFSHISKLTSGNKRYLAKHRSRFGFE